jgi:hypothetical protein
MLLDCPFEAAEGLIALAEGGVESGCFGLRDLRLQFGEEAAGFGRFSHFSVDAGPS